MIIDPKIVIKYMRNFVAIKVLNKNKLNFCGRKSLCPNEDDSQEGSLVYFRY